jgi:uncharacterized caspase-like protein
MSRFAGKETLAPRATRPLLAACALAPLLAFVSPASAEELYGLVVGIDDYVGTVNDLAGAVNDANDVADALKKAGAGKVTLLTDAVATKQAIEAGWRDLVDTAVAGDTIVFSYAGHGGQEPEPEGRNGEEDGLNENFLLAGYEKDGPGSLERIVDDEVYEWLKAADDKGIEVVFVADSCHSGTMFRSAGSQTVRYRTGKFEDPDLIGDLLTLPDPASATAKEDDFRSVTFIAATQDNMLTPELNIEGKPRGALSWAFAKAIRGAADHNGDGRLSQQELLAYIVPTVQAEAENQQIPGILPLRPDQKPIMRSIAGGDAPVVSPAAAVDQSAVRLFVRGGAPEGFAEVTGVEITDDEAAADLIWDAAAGTVDHKIGGRVADGIDAGHIVPVLSKWSALAFIKARTGDDPVALTTPTGNQTYGRGELIEFALAGARFPYLTLFNLPPDGRVEFFMPGNQKEAETDWRGRSMSEKFRVDKPPFGAEHMIAILTEQPAVALHEALKSMPTAEKAGGLAAVLRSTLADTPFQAGVVGIYTEGSE